MRLGLFGNTNNYPLLLAEALRDLGHDVILVVDSADRLHRPENRRAEWESGYPDWIVDGGAVSEWDYISLAPALLPVLDALSSCDALILNSLGPSLLPLLRRPAIAFLTGSDLTHYADHAMLEARSMGWSDAHSRSAEGRMCLHLLRDCVERQRSGIARSEAVSYLPTGIAADGDAILSALGVAPQRRMTILMAEVGRLRRQPPPAGSPLRAFSATRITWKLPPEPGHSILDYKGSDTMIRGLGMFKRSGGSPLEIRLVRKGWHVAEAEQLIAAEGLTGDVTWLPEMPLTAVWEEFARSDIVLEQVGPSMLGMAGMDAMMIGRPVIANGRPEISERLFDEPMPVCHATTPEEVCGWLQRLRDPDERARAGARAHAFATKWFDPRRAAEECLRRLEPAVERGQRTPVADVLAMRRRLLDGAREAEVRAESLELQLDDATADLPRFVQSVLGKALRYVARALRPLRGRP